MSNVDNRVVGIPVHKRRKRNMKMPAMSISAITSVVEHLPVGIVVCSEQKCLYWNAEAEELFSRLDFAPQIGMPLYTFILDGLQVSNEIEMSYLYVARVLPVEIDIEFSVVNAADSNFTFFVFRDVSEMLFNREMTSQLDRLFVMGELAAGIAHEIRNPLASIRGFTQILQSSPDEDASPFYTGMMLTELDRINEMVEELLQLARPRSQPFEKANLIRILDSVILLLNSQAILKNCKVIFTARDMSESILIFCQPNKLKQVFINLIKNAVEASPNGGVIEVSLESKVQFVQVAIADEGPGISPEYIEAVGQKFFTTKENGTGLGLMISRNILREHQGKLQLTSDGGRGTTVHVVLPIVESNAPMFVLQE